ncbi:hypothetical protein JCM8202v2_004518 [Rhodotorula sphaerocarpa]
MADLLFFTSPEGPEDAVQQANAFLRVLFQQVRAISHLAQYSTILAHGSTVSAYFDRVKESALLSAPSDPLLRLIEKIQDLVQQERTVSSTTSLTLARDIAALLSRALASAQTILAASASGELSAAEFTTAYILWCERSTGVAGSARSRDVCIYDDTQAISGCAFDVGTYSSSRLPADLRSHLPALSYNLLAVSSPLAPISIMPASSSAPQELSPSAALAAVRASLLDTARHADVDDFQVRLDRRNEREDPTYKGKKASYHLGSLNLEEDAPLRTLSSGDRIDLVSLLSFPVDRSSDWQNLAAKTGSDRKAQEGRFPRAGDLAHTARVEAALQHLLPASLVESYLWLDGTARSRAATDSPSATDGNFVASVVEAAGIAAAARAPIIHVHQASVRHILIEHVLLPVAVAISPNGDPELDASGQALLRWSHQEEDPRHLWRPLTAQELAALATSTLIDVSSQLAFCVPSVVCMDFLGSGRPVLLVFSPHDCAINRFTMLRPLYESAILRLTAATLAIGRLFVLPDESPDFDSIFKRFSETGESSLSDAFRFPTDLVPIGKGFLETLHPYEKAEASSTLSDLERFILDRARASDAWARKFKNLGLTDHERAAPAVFQLAQQRRTRRRIVIEQAVGPKESAKKKVKMSLSKIKSPEQILRWSAHYLFEERPDGEVGDNDRSLHGAILGPPHLNSGSLSSRRFDLVIGPAPQTKSGKKASKTSTNTSRATDAGREGKRIHATEGYACPACQAVGAPACVIKYQDAIPIIFAHVEEPTQIQERLKMMQDLVLDQARASADTLRRNGLLGIDAQLREAQAKLDDLLAADCV